MSFLLGRSIWRGELLVSGRVQSLTHSNQLSFTVFFAHEVVEISMGDTKQGNLHLPLTKNTKTQGSVIPLVIHWIQFPKNPSDSLLRTRTTCNFRQTSHSFKSFTQFSVELSLFGTLCPRFGSLKNTSCIINASCYKMNNKMNNHMVVWPNWKILQ